MDESGVADAEGPANAGRAEVFVATIERSRAGTRTCTISPASPTDAGLATEWLAAEQGSFVRLDRFR